MLPVFFVERISGLRKGELEQSGGGAQSTVGIQVGRPGRRDQGDSAQDSDLCPKNLHPPRSGEFAGAGAGGGEDRKFHGDGDVGRRPMFPNRPAPFIG